MLCRSVLLSDPEHFLVEVAEGEISSPDPLSHLVKPKETQLYAHLLNFIDKLPESSQQQHSLLNLAHLICIIRVYLNSFYFSD